MNTSITDLRNFLASLPELMRQCHSDIQAIAGRCDAEHRDLTPKEMTAFKGLQAKFDGYEKEFLNGKNELAVLEAEASLDSTPQARIVPVQAIRMTASMHSMPSAAARRAAPIGQQTAEFNNVFAGRQLEDPYAGRFQSFGEFALAVAAGGRDQRLITNAAMTEGEGSTGGFLVPLQFLGDVLNASLQQEVIRPRSNVIPMASKQGIAGVFDYTDQTGAKRAGLQLQWGAEAGSLPEQRGKVREVNLVAHKANVYCRVSAELANDVPLFDQQLGGAMVAAVAAGLDAAFLLGGGVGQPLGIVVAPSTITVAKEGSQAASTLLLQNLAKMTARLSPASFARAIFLIHPTVVVPLYTMSVVVQNVAGTENVGGSSAAAVTVDANGQLRIFGRPAIVSDACAPLGTLGDIVLADLSKYLVGLRADAVIRRDESRYFDTDEIAFKLTLRLDGQPADKDPTTLRDGSNTTSPFVILQAR